MDFSFFDIRNYKTLSVQEGYKEWSTSYEQTVSDLMDIRLLDQISCIDWEKINNVIDLACGTGRIGCWLSKKGIKEINGIDFTQEMLEIAKNKSVYKNLVYGDILATNFEPDYFDLAIEVLADEHISDLSPLYKEASRIIKPNGYFVIIGYHSHFLMNGVITHFNSITGEPLAIKSHVHLFSDHVKAAYKANLTLMDLNEGVIDDEWIKLKPKWQKFYMHPVSFSVVWKK